MFAPGQFFDPYERPDDICSGFASTHFTPEECCVSVDRVRAVAIDRSIPALAVRDEQKRVFYFTGDMLLDCELEVRDHTRERRPLFAMWRRYSLGSFIGGHGLGWVAAQSTQARRETVIESIRLKIRVRDLHTPILSVSFLEGATTTSQCEAAHNGAERWRGMIRSMIRS